jgi:glycosyltransferase involved in cell wall biosynthesis
MRIGVCLGDFVPQVGGGYTFVSQVFDAFLELAASSHHTFVAFCDPAVARRLAAAGVPANVELFGVPAKGGAATAITALKHYSPLFGYLLRRPGRLERGAMRKGVGLAWFVGGGVYDTLDIPYIATVWDVQHRTHPWFPEVSSQGRWDYRELMHARFLRRAARLITGTRVGAEQLGYYYQVPPERITLLPHPTPVLCHDVAGAVSPAVSAFSATRFFFYPAQYWPHKNHVTLLHALKLLGERRGVTANLVLTGSDQGNLGHVQAVATALGLRSQVHFAGFVSSADLVWLYRNAVGIVYPSFSGPENLPPLEAFSLGCPVAISDYPGVDEQIGDAALRFDPRDPAQLADALRRLLEEPSLRDDLIAKGRARLQHRTPQGYVRGVFAIFDEFEGIRRCWG